MMILIPYIPGLIFLKGVYNSTNITRTNGGNDKKISKYRKVITLKVKPLWFLHCIKSLTSNEIFKVLHCDDSEIQKNKNNLLLPPTNITSLGYSLY